MISVDVETTGLDPEKSSLLSIGAVDMNDPTNTFYGECRAFDMALIFDEALNVNGFTMEQAKDKEQPSEKDLIIDFLDYVDSIEKKPIMCGMNVGFDFRFVEHACKRARLKTPFSFRTVDIHSLAYFVYDGKINPFLILSLNYILQSLGLPKEPDPHNALTGAKCNVDCYNGLRKMI